MGCARLERLRLIRVVLVTPNQAVSHFVDGRYVLFDRSLSGPGLCVVDAGQAVLGEIWLTRHPVSPNVIALEKSAKAVVFLLAYRIKLVLVAAGAFEGEPEERHGCVIHSFLQPRI